MNTKLIQDMSKPQIEFKIAKFPDSVYVQEWCDGRFQQSWGPYDTESDAYEATVEISRYSFFSNADIYIIPSIV